MTSSVKPGFKNYMNKARLMLGFVSLCLLFSSCSPSHPKQMEWTGFTMGTTYSVKAIVNDNGNHPSHQFIQSQIDSVLEAVNLLASTYISDSEISKFNRLGVEDRMTFSSGFVELLNEAKRINKITDKAFDITMKPMVDAWGFGVKGRSKDWKGPEKSSIESTLRLTGIENLEINGDIISKKIPELEIDLNAIAKGYGVDKVSELIEKWFSDYMVEVGGEVRARGINRMGNHWAIGIENPQTHDHEKIIMSIIQLNDRSMATSGDYRRFFEFKGKVYSHVIDPRTGYPAESNIASATVIAPSCTEADAMATALMVLGLDKSIKLIESQPEMEAMLMVREEGKILVKTTSGFPKESKTQ